jgi:hypothetical protein
MLESHTQKDIEKISYDILKSSKSWGKFPTSVDTIVQYSDLLVNTKVDVSKIHHGYLSHASDALRRALSKVRGLFDRDDKTIYLYLTQNDQKKNFVKLHEVGHGILPWQNMTTAFLDDDETLSMDHREQFEAEANYFASATLFQLDRFEEEMEKLEFGIKGAMALAKMFGGSNHAAIRRYVEHSKNRCALLVLKDITSKGEIASCRVRDYFQSPKFTKQFGTITWPGQLGFTWAFVQDYYFKKKIKSQNEITLPMSSGSTDFYYDFFDTSYNAFVLFYPKGEKTGGKTKIIIRQ